MDEPSLRLREALDKFIKHVDDLIEEEDPAGNGFHREYRVSFDTSDTEQWVCMYPAHYGWIYDTRIEI